MSADLRCTGTPISWLRLEQLRANELSSAGAKEVREHLGQCAVCAACLAKIAEDDDVALPPLPTLAPAAPPPKKISLLRHVAPVVSALALAAAVVLFLRRPPPVGDDDAGVEPVRIKGGDVSFSLVREDGMTITEPLGTYRDGDRFKAIVTCPPGAEASMDVAVYEGGKPAFPLAAPAKIACGNAVALPGAFRLTGREELSVCLAWNASAPIDRANPTSPGVAFPGAGRLCKVLVPPP